MSRWLRNVNALLENLDNQVEETVDERFNQDDDGPDVNLEEKDGGLDDILAKRGLLDDEKDEGGAAVDLDAADGGEMGGLEEQERGVTEEVVDFDAHTQSGLLGEEIGAGLSPGSKLMKPSKVKEQVGKRKESIGDDEAAATGQTANVENSGISEEQPDESSSTAPEQIKPAPVSSNAPEAPPSAALTAPTPTSANTTSSISISSSALAAKDKELRKYRRNILNLNSALETAESEIEAQRAELDRAASRMERDRSRFKQEKEAAETTHKAEVAALIASHEKALANYKEQQELKMKEMEGRILRAEQARAREGGERDAELAEALERERTSIENVATLTEEKNTLSERVTSLSSEITRLEARLEHASSQFDLASERERNAEEQLDKALSLHARQLGVRQKRESELEQTVADLGAALVVAKNKLEKGIVDAAGAGGEQEEEEGLKERFADAQDEIETLRAQLTLERQRCQTLHSELQDLSKEQADELSVAHARQRQYERNISDLTTTVAKLQSSLKRSNVGSEDDASGDESSANNTCGRDYQYSGDEKKETDHLRKQIASLSEKIFEQQSKLDRSSGEISTMKTRLQSAILRAETAETSLEIANQRLIMMEMPGDGGYAVSGISSADEESGFGTTRRKKGGNKRRVPMGSDASRRNLQRSKVESIRSALGLHPGRIPSGGCQETAAVILDTCDTIAIDLGSHFRQYPLSRLAFMLYMVILHSWAFFLLVYHAHAQGTGGLDHYSPESMMMSYRHAEQVPKAIQAISLGQVPQSPP
ncbi:hypothetical protein ACHAXN_007874 [Cyclotella atomus]